MDVEAEDYRGYIIEHITESMKVRGPSESWNIALACQHLWRMYTPEKARAWVDWHIEQQSRIAAARWRRPSIRTGIRDYSDMLRNGIIGDDVVLSTWSGAATLGRLAARNVSEFAVESTNWSIDGDLFTSVQVYRMSGSLIASGPSLDALVQDELAWESLAHGASESESNS